MKIVKRNDDPVTVPFQDLDYGMPFLYKGSLFIKAELSPFLECPDYVGVRLVDGHGVDFLPGARVLPATDYRITNVPESKR